MSIDPHLLEIIVCPECKGPLEYDDARRLLGCRGCLIAYPVNDKDVPLLIADEAVPLPDKDRLD